MSQTFRAEVLVVGGGLAGIVTALECLRAGKTVLLVDRDTPERLGGLALWAFGGMALVGTPLQSRLRIPDTPEIALRDWIRFGELVEEDVLPRRWAEFYVQHSRAQVHDWLRDEGVRFMPAVNWVERGLRGEGNSLPRYHIVWGTARELVRRMLAALDAAGRPGALRILSRHRVTSLETTAGVLSGAIVLDEATNDYRRLEAEAVVLAMGGINGSTESARENWPPQRPMPAEMLNGAHPFSDGRLHRWVEAHLRGRITHAGEMWNYAAGIPHPQPHFPGHGLSLIPCKSALWLDHAGRRIGPDPLVTGFDTHDLCQRVAALDKPYTWQLLNWRIAAREFAISGAEHNQRIRDRQFLPFVLETLFGNRRLLRQMQRESPHFLVDDTLQGLAAKMNALAGTEDVRPDVLQATADAFDANFRRGLRFQNDDQIRRILHARQWSSDRLRTCRPAPLQARGAGPYIAIQTRLVTRKSLGGLQTDLDSRVLDAGGAPIPGLYAVGEASGFGGGGACGKRSLEGTFLPGCILTARAAARSLATGHGL
jgi:predicted oxidoreductase